MESKLMSNDFSGGRREIPRDECVILPPEEMPRRETIGKRLKTARLDAGLSVPQLREKIFRDHRAEVGDSTIRDIEKDKTPNPGFKTIEFIALGVGLDPLEVISLGLDDPPELDPGFTETQFAQMGRIYKKIPKERKPFADELIKMIIEKMERWRLGGPTAGILVACLAAVL